MHFLRVNVTFYDAVKMIQDVITTANLFQNAAKFMFDCVRNNKTRSGEIIIFSPRLEKYQVSQPR